jgi:probable HAF family extracellular repeat protein
MSITIPSHRRTKITMNSTFKLAFAMNFLLLGTVSAEVLYDVVDLGTLGGNHSCAFSINDNNQIVGIAKNGTDNMRATLFDASGSHGNIDLGTLGGPTSVAYSINNMGQIVGSAEKGWQLDHATLFDPTGRGENVDLGTLGGGESCALAINDSAQIVGWADTTSGYPHAVLFDLSGNNVDLGTLGGNQSSASAISISGIIVGKAYDSSRIIYHATVYDTAGGMSNTNLGTLGGLRSLAASINSQGQIAGSAEAVPGTTITHAALFDPSGDGNNVDLGTLDGWTSEARCINDHGQVVGTGWNGSGYPRATLFDSTGGGRNIDLNTVISAEPCWTLTYSWSINNWGWIVGRGLNPEKKTHAYLLIPRRRVECAMKFTPHAFNPGSEGNWFRLHFVLPDGYDINDVDLTTPAQCTLMDTGQMIESDYVNAFVNEEGLLEVEVRFDRSAFALCLSQPAERTVTVRGLIEGTSGQNFFGTDTLKIINNTLQQIAAFASRWLDARCVEPDWCDGFDLDRNGTVNFADFALSDGCCIEITAP